MRINHIISSLFICLFCCLNCTQESPQIKIIAERTNENSYFFRWEVLPPIHGTVAIYSSFDPNYFDLSQIPQETNISNSSISIPVTNKKDRYFFLFRFNNRYDKITASRFAFSESIINFRDIGGYSNKEEKTIKWGKIYRSGDINVPRKERDNIVFDQIKLKTIINIEDKPLSYQDSTKKIDISIPDLLSNDIINMIKEGKMRKGDVFLYMQEKYLDIYENIDVYFAPMFDILLQEENYPVLITSKKGKDRTGIAVALIMMALDIPYETIIEDYLLSEKYINTQNYKSIIKDAGWEAQEAISLILSPQEKAIEMIRDRILYDYGSIENFLEKRLNLDSTRREKLKQLLLD